MKRWTEEFYAALHARVQLRVEHALKIKGRPRRPVAGSLARERTTSKIARISGRGLRLSHIPQENGE